MIEIMLIAGVALVVAVGLGALIGPSVRAETSHDWAWQYLPACPRPEIP